MAVGILFILSVLVFLSLNTVTIGIKDRGQNTKRILLNDQDVAGQINRDIQSLRQLVNTMKNDMDTQKAKIASQEAEIASQRLEIASQKTKMSSLEVEIISQKTEIASQKAQSAIQQAELARLNVTTPDAGSTYIRWGRTSCSAPGTKMVYTGYAAGQHYNQYSNRFGGPANMLCLPNDPELSNLSTASDSFLWGTEFDENMLKSDAANEDVPCAVCKSTNTHVSIMIPGRLSCYVGWKREYNGVLASDYYGNSASSFICIDIYPDYVPGGQADNNGRLLYFTSIKCGALSCPPYKDGKAVNCVRVTVAPEEASYAAGQHYNQYSNRFGGPANMLCLPNDPELSNLSTASLSFLWGTEFEENMLKSDAVNEDVPCALCKNTNTHVSIMIPGRQSCYDRWKREYNGVLASDDFGYSASSFICVDRHPEYIPSGQRNDNGRLLHFTSLKCGALPCPPYKDGKAVNCVVCSQ